MEAVFITSFSISCRFVDLGLGCLGSPLMQRLASPFRRGNSDRLVESLLQHGVSFISSGGVVFGQIIFLVPHFAFCCGEERSKG